MSDVSLPDGPTSVYVDRYTTDDSDSLSYDNETVRYDYDLIKSGEHEDQIIPFLAHAKKLTIDSILFGTYAATLSPFFKFFKNFFSLPLLLIEGTTIKKIKTSASKRK